MEEEEKKVFDEPTEISLLIPDFAAWPYKEDWYVKKTIEESTNAVLKIIPFESAKYSDKINMLMASGGAPDLIAHRNSIQIKQYASQDAFVNISENMNKLNYFKNWAENNKEHVQKSYAADGKLYSFPSYGIGITNTRFWFYRNDVLDKHNLEVPKTDEELYNVLKVLKEKDPNSFPFIYREFPCLAPSWDTQDDFYYDNDKGEWKFGPIEDNYKEMVTFLRKLYLEKLIPQDIYSMNDKAWTDMMVQGKSYITFDYVGRVAGLLDTGKELNSEYSLEYMRPLNGKFIYSAVEYSGTTISKDSKNTDDLLKFMDWFYSDEAYELLSWGKEGVTYEINNGKKEFLDKNYRAAYGIGNVGWFSILKPEPLKSVFPDICIKALDERANYEVKENPALYMGLNDEESEIKATVGTAIKKFKDENVALFITGQKDMSEWDAYVKSITEMGVDKMIEVYTGAYSRLGN